jgi:hypothetical protein
MPDISGRFATLGKESTDGSTQYAPSIAVRLPLPFIRVLERRSRRSSGPNGQLLTPFSEFQRFAKVVRECENSDASMHTEEFCFQVRIQKRHHPARVKLFLAKELFSDVRPEFLEDVIEDSRFHLSSEVHCRLIETALLRRIIKV